MTTVTNVLPQTYSSKATAKRGALRAGLSNFKCEQNAEGRWVVIDCAGLGELFTPREPVVDMEANDVAEMIAEAKAAPVVEEQGPDLAQVLGNTDTMGRRRRSVDPAGATARVRDICAALYNKWQAQGQNPDTKPKRKDYMNAAIEQGIAYYTVRTQVQKFLQGAA